MKFVVIYPNTVEAKTAIFGKLVEWSKKVDLEKNGINANHFKIVKDWPTKEVLNEFPLNLQVEEVCLIDDKVLSIRKFVNDVESEIVTEKVIEVIEEQSKNEEKV